ncbi:MAG: hypothetical protein QOH57_686 [Mycobacterium sp.]|nr:hypothetical protein [Mycobacterium sp.]
MIELRCYERVTAAKKAYPGGVGKRGVSHFDLRITQEDDGRRPRRCAQMLAALQRKAMQVLLAARAASQMLKC